MLVTKADMAATSVMGFLVRVGGATEGVLAYLGGLAQLTGRALSLLVVSPLKRRRSVERAFTYSSGHGFRRDRCPPSSPLDRFFHRFDYGPAGRLPQN